MKENLYTFSTNVWHVRLFKWLYNTDPTQTFNTMCPYFWSLVVTFLLFPLILVLRLLGKWGANILSKLESYRRDKRAKNVKLLEEKCAKKDLTNEEAYNIKQSSLWEDYNNYIDYDLCCLIYNKARNHAEIVYDINKLKQEQKEQKVKEIKESTLFIYTSYITSFVVFSLLLYLIYYGISLIEIRPIDWDVVREVLTILGELIGGGVLILLAFIYIIFPFLKWLPFKSLYKGILIVGDMIYMTYKKACPIITWKKVEE